MGFAYIGCLRMLEEYKIIGQNIEFLAGCSIGAVFATIISIGYSSSELYDFVLNFANMILLKTLISLDLWRIMVWKLGIR